MIAQLAPLTPASKVLRAANLSIGYIYPIYISCTQCVSRRKSIQNEEKDIEIERESQYMV